MDKRASPAMRYLRAAILAFIALSTGAVAHTTAAGRLPSVGGMVMLYVACTLGMAFFLGRPATVTRIVALTVGGQVGVHMLLSLTAGHAGDPAVAQTAQAARVARPAPTPIDASATGSTFDTWNSMRPQVEAEFAIPHAVIHMLEDLTSGAHAPMMVLHLVAAVLVGLWLAVGEQALWTLVALAATVLLPALLAVLPLPRPHRATPAARTAAPSGQLVVLARSVVRRGPPHLLAS